MPFGYDAEMTLLITISEHPSDADRDAIAAPLRAFNIARGGDPRIRSVAILLTTEDGSHVGGLWGKCAYDWLFVDLLTVPEEYRGGSYGKKLMAQAESIARANGCIGVYLDTFEFQARGFYEKLGFEVFGELEDHPIGQRKFFLRKRLQ
jgi:GNAT superfamily N-acetyltransferase